MKTNQNFKTRQQTKIFNAREQQNEKIEKYQNILQKQYLVNVSTVCLLTENIYMTLKTLFTPFVVKSFFSTQ